jgi:Sugar diacid utilization regulator
MSPSQPRPVLPESDVRAWIDGVGEAAARRAGLPLELLGAYLDVLAGAALEGRRPQQPDLIAVRDLGRCAAAQEISAGQMVDLYLAAAARLWRTVPVAVRSRNRDAVSAAAEAVLEAIDDAVAALLEAHQDERRRMIRHEESVRREFIDDLLRGDADVASLVVRGEPFGLDLARPHQVALAVPSGRPVDEMALATALERSLADRYAGRDLLVTSKEGQLVIVAPDVVAQPAGRDAAADLGTVVQSALGSTARSSRRWRIATGRAYPGGHGVARSYEEAREALRVARALRWDKPVVRIRDVLVHRVLARDQAAVSDLVQEVLGPLARARGGAEPLLDTLEGYFDSGEVATETARRLHLSVRTVTYRLARVTELTGYDTADPASRFALHVAVRGARLLGWPQRDLPPSE